MFVEMLGVFEKAKIAACAPPAPAITLVPVRPAFPVMGFAAASKAFEDCEPK